MVVCSIDLLIDIRSVDPLALRHDDEIDETRDLGSGQDADKQMRFESNDGLYSHLWLDLQMAIRANSIQMTIWGEAASPVRRRGRRRARVMRQ